VRGDFPQKRDEFFANQSAGTWYARVASQICTWLTSHAGGPFIAQRLLAGSALLLEDSEAVARCDKLVESASTKQGHTL